MCSENSVTIAETERLLLRDLRPVDAQRMFEIYSDPQVMRFMGPPPESVEEETKNIQTHIDNYYRRHGYGLWAVVEKQTGEIIGRAGLLRFELRSAAQVEISYLLSRPHWGQAYATEAGAAVVQHAFAVLGLDRLFALIQTENHPSARVAERLGFVKQGSVPYKQFGLVDLYERVSHHATQR